MYAFIYSSRIQVSNVYIPYISRLIQKAYYLNFDLIIPLYCFQSTQ
jgi:hypothetical protein